MKYEAGQSARNTKSPQLEVKTFQTSDLPICFLLIIMNLLPVSTHHGVSVIVRTFCSIYQISLIDMFTVHSPFVIFDHDMPFNSFSFRFLSIGSIFLDWVVGGLVSISKWRERSCIAYSLTEMEHMVDVTIFIQYILE